MKRECLLFGLIVMLLLPMSSLHAAHCSGEAEELSTILYEGIGRMRRRLEEVRKENGIDSDLKAEFIQQSDWIIAWTQDQVVQVDRWECSSLASIAGNAYVQWLPLELLSRRVFITSIMQHIDDDRFTEAQDILQQAQDADTLVESRILVHRAVFSIRNTMRSYRKTATMEGV